jgi:hypothetical protein
MELAGLKFTVSAVFVLSAATGAMLFDFFRRKHEQLRALVPSRGYHTEGHEHLDSASPSSTADAFLWEHLSNGIAPHAPEPDIQPAPAQTEMKFEIIRGANQLSTPSGMIDQATLQSLLPLKKGFTGLVVAIGIHEASDGMWRGEGFYKSVSNFLAGLLGEHDFVCRAGHDEFVIVCPDKHAENAQRSLDRITESLWDFQLRGMGICSILFSWGAITVNNEQLAVAINSATTRMRETERIGSKPAADAPMNISKAI